MGIKVLVVDDEEMFARSLADRLALRDFGVAISLSGEDALEKVKAFNYDVVILDLAMPGLGGIDTLREIKRIKALTEVILLTGRATVESAIEGMKLGAHDFLMKPCEAEELVAKIKSAYEKKSEQEERIRTARVSEIVSSPRSVLEK